MNEINTSTLFHLAIPVSNLNTAREFFEGVLQCRVGRQDKQWMDFDFFGHQLTVHVQADRGATQSHTWVDGDHVPVPHFGAVLPWAEWEALCDHLQATGVPRLFGPRVRFQGQAGEQGTLFIAGPDGHVLEFKSFRDTAAVFAR